MKALPLWQPWATLVAVGAKQIETRHWPAPRTLLGQRIAIHATLFKGELWMLGTEPFLRRLRAAREHVTLINDELPLGHLLCTVVLDRCVPITAEMSAALLERNPDEHAFGNYSTERQRYAWVLRDVQRLRRPVPWKGSQGVFEVPDQVLGYTPAQGTLGS